MVYNFSPKGKFLWDLWFISDRGKYHVFYLQSKRTEDAENRHNANVSIGHAVSRDLEKWEELPTALRPGKPGSWDDLALWTGSIIKKGGKYYMFYTGRNRDAVWIQKIGLAVSDNLMDWEKNDSNPVLEADERYYRMGNRKNKLGEIPAWRDPFVFRDPKSGRYYMTITAREKGRKVYNGCIAIAESGNLADWKVLPPLLAPKRYDEMETSQMVYHKGRYYLFFGVGWRHSYEPGWKRKAGVHTGLHCYYSDSLFGEYRPVNGNGVVVEHAEKLYDVRLVQKKGNRYTAIGWLNLDENKKFIGKMSAPFELVIEKDRVLEAGV